MTYLLQFGEDGPMQPCESIPQAHLLAETEAKSHQVPLHCTVWDTRPATPEDRDLFEGSEDVDVTLLNWWDACIVPVNVVDTFITKPQLYLDGHS